MPLNKPENARDMNELSRVLEGLPHCKALGLKVIELLPGRATLRLPYKDHLIGNFETGVVHGGVITSLLDTAGGIAAFAMLPDGVSVATLDLRIDYLKPATPGNAILGQTEVIKLTRSVAFVRGHAYHEGSFHAPIAHATGAFMLGSVGFKAQAPELGAPTPDTQDEEA